jgi:hypothetical protein
MARARRVESKGPNDARKALPVKYPTDACPTVGILYLQHHCDIRFSTAVENPRHFGFPYLDFLFAFRFSTVVRFRSVAYPDNIESLICNHPDK